MVGLHWLASSEGERQHAMELARALEQKESRDELGLGTVRDAIADLLFPGTSTLHTRARYHLFIPWAYQRAVAKKGGASLSARVRAAEIELIAALKVSGDLDGLIGRDAGANLKRMPSTLYWQGLHTWGVRRAGGPQRAIERLIGRRSAPALRDDEGQILDGAEASVWHQSLPPAPAGHPAAATFRLSRDEAEFLAERLRTEPRTTSTALAQLVEIPAEHGSVAWAWEHPQIEALRPETRRVIEQARRFSLLMHGASWLYNVILASMLESSREVAHRADFAAWADRVAADDDLAGWDLLDLWDVTGSRVPTGARRFAARWQGHVRHHGPHGLVDRADARALIIDRERTMKRGNARTANRRALEQWGGASGTLALDYRWTTARRLLNDIREGLEAPRAAH